MQKQKEKEFKYGHIILELDACAELPVFMLRP